MDNLPQIWKPSFNDVIRQNFAGILPVVARLPHPSNPRDKVLIFFTSEFQQSNYVPWYIAIGETVIFALNLKHLQMH